MTYGFPVGDIPDDPLRWAEGLANLQAPMSAYYAAVRQETQETNPTALLGRTTPAPATGGWGPYVQGLDQPPAPELAPEDLNAQFGIPDHLTFTEPMTATRAAEIHDIKRRELYRADVMRRAQPGVFGTLGGFAVGLVESGLDPINFAANFVPVWGQVKWARMAEQAATVGGRIAGRAALGAVQGVQGALLTEALVYPLATQEMRDYGALDSLMNIAIGTALGGGLHALGAAAGEIGRAHAALRPDAAAPEAVARVETPVGRAVEELSPEARADVLRRTVDQFARDETIDVGGSRAAGYRITPAEVRAHAPIETVTLTSEWGELPGRGAFDRARAWLRKNLQGRALTNAETGWADIQVGRKAIQKMVAPRSKEGAFRPMVEAETVRVLPELMDRAVLVETRPDRLGSPDVLAVHRFYAPLTVDGKPYRAKLTVKEFRDGRRIYDHRLTELEEADAVTSGPASGAMDTAVAQPGPAPASKMDVGRLLADVNFDDATPVLSAATAEADSLGDLRIAARAVDDEAYFLGEAAALDGEMTALRREGGLTPEMAASLDEADGLARDADAWADGAAQAVTCLIRGVS